jgi:hypothetical protein
MLLNHYLPVEDMAWLSRKLGNVELNSLEFAVKSQTGLPLHVAAITSSKWALVTVFNIEVESLHCYFVEKNALDS